MGCLPPLINGMGFDDNCGSGGCFEVLRYQGFVPVQPNLVISRVLWEQVEIVLKLLFHFRRIILDSRGVIRRIMASRAQNDIRAAAQISPPLIFG